MSDRFILQDVYVGREKKMVKSAAKPLTCDLCKKELNGFSITAKKIDGKIVFLCSNHYKDVKPYQIVSVS